MSSDYPVLDYNDQLTKQFDQRMLSPQLLAKAFLENQKLRIDNKFSPLETLIKAQNAQSYASTRDAASRWLRLFNALPADYKKVELSDPDKKAYYDKMQQQAEQGGSPSTYLTPELLKQYYPELGNNIAQGMNATNQNNQAPQQPYNSPSAVQNLTNTLQSSSNSGNAPQMNKGGGMPNYAAQSASVTPENNENMPQTNNPPNGVNTGQQTGQTHPSIKDQPLSDGIKSLPVPDTRTSLTPSEKSQLAFQVLANNKLADPKAVARADAAMALHLMLLKPENRKTFSDKINNALQYVGAKGKGQMALNSLLMKVPSAQVDYDFVLSELNPNTGNNVKMMEGLSSSDKQRNQLSEASDKAYKSLTYNKENAKQLINSYYDLLLKQGQANIDSVEGLTPGAREKLWGIPKLNGDYILPEQGKVYITGPNGIHYKVSQEQADRLLKEHPTAKRMG